MPLIESSETASLAGNLTVNWSRGRARTEEAYACLQASAPERWGMTGVMQPAASRAGYWWVERRLSIASLKIG